MLAKIFAHIFFVSLNVGLGVYYWRLALISNSAAPPEMAIYQTMLTDLPLGVAAAIAIFGFAAIDFKRLPWVLLILLTLGTIWMHKTGFNFGGAIIGLLNVSLCWAAGIRTVLVLSRSLFPNKALNPDSPSASRLPGRWLKK